jgi:hypothetical protein
MQGYRSVRIALYLKSLVRAGRAMRAENLLVSEFYRLRMEEMRFFDEAVHLK